LGYCEPCEDQNGDPVEGCLRATFYGCDPDWDLDGVPNDGDGDDFVFGTPCPDGTTVGCDDNCVFDFNPDQTDSDQNGQGDACDTGQPPPPPPPPDCSVPPDECASDSDCAAGEFCAPGCTCEIIPVKPPPKLRL
jgi:hypothetical protein